jgi:hypothetical protein
LLAGDEIGPTSGSHNLASKERIEEVTERGNEKGQVSSIMARKHDRVRAEYENELTELIEREPFIQEREKRRKGSG